jgi:hypothetical protein
MDEFLKRLFGNDRSNTWTKISEREDDLSLRLNLIYQSNPKLYKKLITNFATWEKFFSGDGITQIITAIDKNKKTLLKRYDAFAIECRKEFSRQFAEKISSEQDEDRKRNISTNSKEILKALNENLSGLRQFIVKYIDFHIKACIKHNVEVLHEYLLSPDFKEKFIISKNIKSKKKVDSKNG